MDYSYCCMCRPVRNIASIFQSAQPMNQTIEWFGVCGTSHVLFLSGTNLVYFQRVDQSKARNVMTRNIGRFVTKGWMWLAEVEALPAGVIWENPWSNKLSGFETDRSDLLWLHTIAYDSIICKEWTSSQLFSCRNPRIVWFQGYKHLVVSSISLARKIIYRTANLSIYCKARCLPVSRPVSPR